MHNVGVFTSYISYMYNDIGRRTFRPVSSHTLSKEKIKCGPKKTWLATLHSHYPEDHLHHNSPAQLRVLCFFPGG